MEKTINQIVAEFESFADRHKIIKSFIFQPIEELKADNLIYPMLYIALGSIAFTDNGAYVSITLNVNMLDRIKRDKSNSTNVWSDTLLLINDLYVQYGEDYECDNGFYIVNPLVATPIYADYDDLVNGYTAPFVIKVGNMRNHDQIPLA